jgi:predicted N-acyltransferase
VDAARAQAQEWGAQALVVANLSRDIADRLAARLPPDLRIWLDASYELRLPPSSDGYFAGLRRDDRADLRRRWRRASERSVVFAEIEGGDLAARLPEFLELANASVVKHGIEPTYDLPTFEALARVPGARLLVAERGDEMLAGFYAFPANGCLTLWSGGIRYSALREFSPYVFLLYETVALSYRQGWRTIDFGRGNGGFKIRHGCTRQELWSSVYFAHEPQPEALRRLRTLHERLCRIDAAA